MLLLTCYTPHQVSHSDKSVGSRSFEHEPNLLLKRYLIRTLMGALRAMVLNHELDAPPVRTLGFIKYVLQIL